MDSSWCGKIVSKLRRLLKLTWNKRLTITVKAPTLWWYLARYLHCKDLCYDVRTYLHSYKLSYIHGYLLCVHDWSYIIIIVTNEVTIIGIINGKPRKRKKDSFIFFLDSDLFFGIKTFGLATLITSSISANLPTLYYF